MKNAEITAMTYEELKNNFAMFSSASLKLQKYVEKGGGTWFNFINDFQKEISICYNLMMRRTAGDFSVKEWFNLIVC